MSTEVATKQEEQNQVAQVSGRQGEAAALMNIIDRLSTQPELDLDRVERLFEMHQQMLSRQQEQAFNEDMARAQSEIQSVVTNKHNTHTKSGYADLDAIHESAKPIWTQHGFSVVSRTARSEIEDHVRVICEVRHASGHKERHEDDWPLDTAGAKGGANKTAIQGKGSTITYARRYTELMIFDVAIKDDNDGNTPPPQTNPAAEPITHAQLKNLREAMEAANVDDGYVCQKAGIQQLTELQQGRLSGAIAHLNKLAKEREQ